MFQYSAHTVSTPIAYVTYNCTQPLTDRDTCGFTIAQPWKHTSLFFIMCSIATGTLPSHARSPSRASCIVKPMLATVKRSVIYAVLYMFNWGIKRSNILALIHTYMYSMWSFATDSPWVIFSSSTCNNRSSFSAWKEYMCTNMKIAFSAFHSKKFDFQRHVVVY